MWLKRRRGDRGRSSGGDGVMGLHGGRCSWKWNV